MATCLQWRRNENMFPSDFNSICFKCNILVRAAAIPASKTTPVEAEKVTYWTFSFPRHQQHHSLLIIIRNMLARWPTVRRQISRTVALFALAALARGRALLWVRSGLVLGQMHHEHDQLQQQNIKFIIKLVSSSPGVIISCQTSGNWWCWRWLPRKMYGSYVQVRLRNGTSDKTLWDT